MLPTRRELVSAGSLSLLGLTLSGLQYLRSCSPSARSEKHRRNSCVFFFLFGGPSQIDLWDMKPMAPAEIRGEFTPRATSVPGIQVCEHLPRFAGVMDKVCLVRSMNHRMNVHGPACSEVFTGREYFAPPTTDQARREDWPSLSSLVTRYGETQRGLPPSVVLPWYLQFPGQAKRIAGQTGGRMSERYNPFLLEGDLGNASYHVEGLAPTPGLPHERLARRKELLHRLEQSFPKSQQAMALDRNFESVFELLGNKAGRVFDLRQEPEPLRARYGQTTVGQSLLLARRLVEAGVGLVTVNWQDATKIDGVNTCWDTHQNSFPKMKSLLCPIFDQAFPTFLEDLDQRGLLETTLVVALGEFGRTPKLGQFEQSTNTKKSGRDHWPRAFTAILAGGGVRGGQVYGSTTSDGGYVKDKSVTPADLTATILHHLGIDSSQHYVDEFQQLRNRLSEGTAIRDLG